MTWIEAARGPFERLLEAEEEAGKERVRLRLEGLRLAYLELRAEGTDRPLAEGTDAARTKGPWVLWMLRTALSPLPFERIREEWKRGGALETRELRTLAEREAGADLGAFFDFWVYGLHLPEYRVRRAEARAEDGQYPVTVLVENRGSGAWPVPVVIQTEEGARHVFRAAAASGEQAETRFSVVTRPQRVAIDPEDDVLMSCGDRPWVPVRIRRFWFF